MILFSKKIFTLIILVIFTSGFALSQSIYNGHSHNDYQQKRPLHEALKYGYKSIEIDVWLHHGELKVAHVKVGLNKKPSIEEQYFKPLAEIIQANKGSVYPQDSTPLILMIELKNQRDSAYARLKNYLAGYDQYLCKWQGDSLVQSGALSILITGGAPRATIAADSIRIANVDGNTNDTTQNISSVFVPRISISWNSYFTWSGAGKMPKEELKKLNKFVEAAHASRKSIRFYAAPDNYGIWKQLLNIGVDWINTNNLKAFATYYNSRGK